MVMLQFSYSGSLMEREWSCYGGGQENGHVREVASLMEGEWSCYGGGQFSGQRMVMLQKWRENGHVREVVSLMKGEWSCYGGGAV